MPRPNRQCGLHHCNSCFISSKTSSITFHTWWRKKQWTSQMLVRGLCSCSSSFMGECYNNYACLVRVVLWSIYAIYDMGQDRVGDCICLHASSSNNGNGPGDNSENATMTMTSRTSQWKQWHIGNFIFATGSQRVIVFVFPSLWL